MGDLIKRETVFAVALLALMVAVFYGFYRIMAPFFVPITWGAVLVITVYPAHVWLSRAIRRPSLCALVSTMLVALVILIPSGWLVTTLVSEVTGLYERLQSGWGAETAAQIATRLDPIFRALTKHLQGIVDLSRLNFQDIALGAIGKISAFIVGNATAAVTNAVRAVFQFFLMLLTMYYLFKDGPRLVEKVRASIPLPDDRSGLILAHVTGVVRATIYGGLAVSALQGILGGCLFWILGLPSAAFWGTVMGVLTLIPLLGAFLVYLPAALILLATGSYVKAIILLAVGIGLVSQIDNVLKPMIISGRTAMHPLLMFFSIGGGVAVFGFLGLVLGPVIAAVFVATFDLYRVALAERNAAAP